MTASEYQRLAMRTNDGHATNRLFDKMNMTEFIRPNHSWDLGGILNGCLGLSGEAGEFNDMIKKWIFHEKPLDEEHAKKEIGDVLWYVAMICESFGWNMNEIMQMNIDKLNARYPKEIGFTPELANNRKEGDV